MQIKNLIIFLILNLFFIACNSKVKNENVDSETEEIIENVIEEINSPEEFYHLWDSFPSKQLPLNETTNFDNIKKGKELNDQEIKTLLLNEIYLNFNKEGYHYQFYAAYKLELSKNFYTIVITVFKGEHELETILINYSLDEKLIAYKIIAYDEIAESQSRKFSKIDKINITITDEFYLEETKTEITKFHINTSGELNPITMEFTSDLRPKKTIVLNKIYTDTIQFSAYDDDYDYKLLVGEKNEKQIA